MVNADIVCKIPYILVLVTGSSRHLWATAHAANPDMTVLILVVIVVVAPRNV